MDKKPIGVGVIPLALRDEALMAFQYLLLEVNRLQSALEFEILPGTNHSLVEMLDGPPPIEVDRSEVNTLIPVFFDNYCKSIKQWAAGYGLPDPAPHGIVILSNARFLDNYYSTWEHNVHVLALGNWERHLAPPSIVEFFLFLTLRYSIGFIDPSLHKSIHFGTKGCFWDFTPEIGNVRFKILNGFICQECQSRLKALGLGDFIDELKSILRKDWMGSPDDYSSPAGISTKLGYNLFISKGLKPTLYENFKSAVSQEWPKQLAKVVGGIILAALLLWLGIKG